MTPLDRLDVLHREPRRRELAQLRYERVTDRAEADRRRQFVLALEVRATVAELGAPTESPRWDFSRWRRRRHFECLGWGGHVQEDPEVRGLAARSAPGDHGIASDRLTLVEHCLHGCAVVERVAA